MYLRSLLEYKALDAVSGFTLSDKNYEFAIQILKERFGRSDLVISSHVQKLLSLEPVRNSNNIKALRKLFDECEIQIRSLESLNVTTGTYGNLLTPIILQKIPEDLNLEFNRSRKAENDFDINELITFLRKEINCREAAGLLNNYNNRSFEGNRFTRPEQQKNDRYENNKPTACALSILKSTTASKCIFCEHSKYK